MGWVVLSLMHLCHAADYFGTPAGSGNYSGSKWADALQLNKAGGLQEAWDAMGSSDTLYVGSGDYTIIQTLTLTASNDGESADLRKRIVGVDRGSGYPRFIGGFDDILTNNEKLFEAQTGASYFSIENICVTNYSRIFRALSKNHGYQFRNVQGWNTKFGFESQGCATNENANVGSSNIVFEAITLNNVAQQGFTLRYGHNGVLFKDCVVDAGGKPYDDVLHVANNANDLNNRVCFMVSKKDNTNPFVGDDVPTDKSVVFINCSANNAYNAVDANYWEGDGFVIERWCEVSMYNCSAFGNTDGGFDVKANELWLEDCVSIGNKRNFRLWTIDEPAVMKNCLSAYATKFDGSFGGKTYVAGTPCNMNVTAGTNPTADIAKVNATNCTLYCSEGWDVLMNYNAELDLVNSLVITTDGDAGFPVYFNQNGGVNLNNSKFDPLTGNYPATITLLNSFEFDLTSDSDPLASPSESIPYVRGSFNSPSHGSAWGFYEEPSNSPRVLAGWDHAITDQSHHADLEETIVIATSGAGFDPAKRVAAGSSDMTFGATAKGAYRSTSTASGAYQLAGNDNYRVYTIENVGNDPVDLTSFSFDVWRHNENAFSNAILRITGGDLRTGSVATVTLDAQGVWPFTGCKYQDIDIPLADLLKESTMLAGQKVVFKLAVSGNTNTVFLDNVAIQGKVSDLRVLAGWHNASQPTPGSELAADVLTDGLAATNVFGTGWDNYLAAGSVDLTFGTALPGAVASTNNGSGAYLTKSTSGAVMDYSIENRGTSSYELTSLSFDVWRWTVNASAGAEISIVGSDLKLGSYPFSIGHVVFPIQSSSPGTTIRNYDDFDISLAGLPDRILKPGDRIQFRLAFDAAVSAINCYLDNVAVIGREICDWPDVLLAGWYGASDTQSVSGRGADLSMPGIVASQSWNHNAQLNDCWNRVPAGSDDETFGFSVSGALKSTNNATGAFMTKTTSSVYMDFTIANNSAKTYALKTFCFDAWRMAAGAISGFDLHYDSGSGFTPVASGAFAVIGGAPPTTTDADYEDKEVDLSPLGLDLADGDTIAFRLYFTNATANINFYIDNVGILAEVHN